MLGGCPARTLWGLASPLVGVEDVEELVNIPEVNVDAVQLRLDLLHFERGLELGLGEGVIAIGVGQAEDLRDALERPHLLLLCDLVGVDVPKEVGHDHGEDKDHDAKEQPHPAKEPHRLHDSRDQQPELLEKTEQPDNPREPDDAKHSQDRGRGKRSRGYSRLDEVDDRGGDDESVKEVPRIAEEPAAISQDAQNYLPQEDGCKEDLYNEPRVEVIL